MLSILLKHLSEGKKERRQKEITHTHVKAFSQTLFSYLLSNMNLSYNHCYKIQLLLLSCIMALIPSNHTEKTTQEIKQEWKMIFCCFTDTSKKSCLHWKGGWGWWGCGCWGLLLFYFKINALKRAPPPPSRAGAHHVHAAQPPKRGAPYAVQKQPHTSQSHAASPRGKKQKPGMGCLRPTPPWTPEPVTALWSALWLSSLCPPSRTHLFSSSQVIKTRWILK